MVVVETITPGQASAWIRHSHQREIDLLKCRMMLDDIETGEGTEEAWLASRQKIRDENPYPEAP